MATETPVTVGTDGAPTRDYSDLTAWESDRQRDIKTADEIEMVACYNDGVMSDTVTIAGWTTDATRYIKIYTPESERHDGTLGTGFRLDGGSSGNVVYTTVPNVWIEGLSIKTTASGNYCIYPYLGYNADVEWIRISHNICDGNGINIGVNGGNVQHISYVRNNFLIGGIYGFRWGANSASILGYFYSNSLYGYGYDGFGLTYNQGNAIIKNCIAVDCTADFRNSGYAHADSEFNGSSAGSGDADEAPGNDCIYSMVDTDTFVDVSGGAEDLHTKDVSSPQFQAGTDLTLDANLPFNDDIDGVERGSPWDMGADNLRGAGAPISASITHIIMMMSGR